MEVKKALSRFEMGTLKRKNDQRAMGPALGPPRGGEPMSRNAAIWDNGPYGSAAYSGYTSQTGCE